VVGKKGKIALNPVRHVQMVVDTGKNKREGAFTWMIAAAGGGVKASQRVYLTAAFTGIRAGDWGNWNGETFILMSQGRSSMCGLPISKNHNRLHAIKTA